MGCSSSKNINTTGPEPEQPTLAKVSPPFCSLVRKRAGPMEYAELALVRRHLTTARVARLEMQR